MISTLTSCKLNEVSLNNTQVLISSDSEVPYTSNITTIITNPYNHITVKEYNKMTLTISVNRAVIFDDASSFIDSNFILAPNYEIASDHVLGISSDYQDFVLVDLTILSEESEIDVNKFRLYSFGDLSNEAIFRSKCGGVDTSDFYKVLMKDGKADISLVFAILKNAVDIYFVPVENTGEFVEEQIARGLYVDLRNLL